MSLSAEPIRLIGNPEENFYVLGKKHQEAFRSLYARFTTQSEFTQTLNSIKALFRKTEAPKLANNHWASWLKNYCEGLEVPVQDYLEFLTNIEKSALPSSLPAGCTSAFCWDQSIQGVQHVRLLDWPLSMGHEPEIIYIEVPKAHALVLIGIKALPFLPFSAMNSEGVTMAIHGKFNSLFHREGGPIGEAVIESLLISKDVGDIRKNLKHFQSVHHWGLYSSDGEGNILAMDIAGPQVDVVSSEISTNQNMIFNNLSVVKNKASIEAQPQGYALFCRQRYDWSLEKLKNTSVKSPLLKMTQIHQPHSYPAPAVTLSTVQSLQLTPSSRSLDFTIGEPPLWNQGKIIRYENLFYNHMRGSEEITTKLKGSDVESWQTLHELSLAQKFMDQGELTEAFHYIQMAHSKAQGETANLLAWVWPWWQWKHLKGKRMRHFVYKENAINLKKTGLYHEHLKLLQLLFELELSLSSTVTPMDLSGKFKLFAETVLKMPYIERSLYLKKIDPRLDIQDLILPSH
jgi:hypothetical protein